MTGRKISSFTLAAVFLLSGCTAETVKPAFSNVERIGPEFTRGVSTKTNVLLLLGEPDGPGEIDGFRGARGDEHLKLGAAQIWYYENVKAALGMGGSLNTNQQILAVFFAGDKFDGFFWFKNKIEGRWQSK